MSQSLNSCLNEITESLESISNRNFKHPGIFHNAVVSGMLTNGGKKEFVKLLRDGEPNEELSLFEVDPKKRTIRRRDGKEGVYDYLTEKESILKRNRRMGIEDPKPIIQIPKEFYLKQHEKVLSSKQDNTTRSTFMFNDSTNNYSNNDNGAFKVLFSKFTDDIQITKLLQALQNGSVFMEDDGHDSDSMPKRRKTMFVEDFAVDLIIKVLNEIDNLWSLSEFKNEFSTLKQSFSEISEKVNEVEMQIQSQEKELEAATSYSSSSNSIVRLIETNRKEIMEMEEEIRELESKKAEID